MNTITRHQIFPHFEQRVLSQVTRHMKSLKAVNMPYRELLSLATTLLRQYPTFNRLCTAENTEEMSQIARKHSNAHEKATGICRVCFR